MTAAKQNFEFKCFYCDNSLNMPVGSKYCPHCGKPITFKAIPDPEEQCGNCHEYFESDDLYCRYCGTKKGEGAYAPYPYSVDIFLPSGGPIPLLPNHICKNCGYTWKTCLNDDREKFCPKCGSEAPPLY